MVDSSKAMGGQDLIASVVELTGLPEAEIRPELERLLAENKLDPNNISLDQLRAVLLRYLDSVHHSMTPSVH